jgi:hypothetical protein
MYIIYLHFFSFWVSSLKFMGKMYRNDGAAHPVRFGWRAGLPAPQQPGVPVQQEHLVHARHVLRPLHDQVPVL